MKESFLVVEGKSPKRTREQLKELSLFLSLARALSRSISSLVRCSNPVIVI